MRSAQKPKPRLSDGRPVRFLIDTKGKLGEKGRKSFNQAEMFKLRSSSFLLPNERPLNVKELDKILHNSIYPELNVNGWWRSNRYGVYRKGFQKDPSLKIGEKIIWVENSIDYTCEIPDVRHPHNTNIGLREATGMLDFDLDKLQYNEGKRIVSVAADFNPETDVRVIDITSRPALVDANGYPIRSKEFNHQLTTEEFENNPEIRYALFRDSDHEMLEDSTGWHGSVALSTRIKRCIYAVSWWYEGHAVAVTKKE